MHTIEELVNINNELRKNLNEENLKYYEDMLIYIRTGAIFKKEIETEEVLMELLNDLIDAQNKGFSAIDYFGKDPKKMSDELLKNIGEIGFKESAKFFYTCFGIYVLVNIFSSLINSDKGFDIKEIIIGFVVSLLTVYLLLKQVSKDIYSDKNLDSKKKLSIKNFVKYFLILSIQISIIVLSKLYLTEFYIIKLKGSLGIIVILSLTVFATKILSKDKLYQGFIPMILMFSAVGVLSRIGNYNEYFNSKDGILLTIVFMFIGMSLNILNAYLRYKDKN